MPGFWKYGATSLACGGAHWDAGRGAATALAQSCNSFFYQVGVGLEKQGVERALQRFGMLKPVEKNDFTKCWQAKVPGLLVARPRIDPKMILPRLAIGYGVEAAPLSVARAYAGIATGTLPTLGLRLGERRTVVQLGDIGESLEFVRAAMRDVMSVSLRGTGRKLTLLNELQVHGKTGTAEISKRTGYNNSWFAGFMPAPTRVGIQLVFCAVVYHVPDGVHGDEAAGGLVQSFIEQLQRDPQLAERYLTPMEGR